MGMSLSTGQLAEVTYLLPPCRCQGCVIRLLLSTFMHQVISPLKSKANLHIIPQEPSALCVVCLLAFETEPSACHSTTSSEPQDSPVSASPALRLQACTTMPNFLHRLENQTQVLLLLQQMLD